MPEAISTGTGKLLTELMRPCGGWPLSRWDPEAVQLAFRPTCAYQHQVPTYAAPWPPRAPFPNV